MEDERTLIIGFDLCDDYSQISCIPKNSNEPESVCITPDQSKFLIPTAVCVRETGREWLIGEEAERCRDRMGGEYVDRLLSRLEKKEEVEIYGSVFSAEVLLGKYFRKVLGIIRQRFQNNSILQLVITVRRCDPSLEESLYRVMESLGIGQDRVKIISHSMSFMYYIVSQPRDLWVNDVALFDYGPEGLSYTQLSFGRKGMQTSVVAEYTDFSEEMPYGMLSVRPAERLVHSFENLAGLTLHKKIITSLFITGRGFEGNWSDDTLRSLCMGRRVFKGQNLYTKGACYAARAMKQNRLTDYVFLPEDKIRTEISLNVYHNAGAEKLPLAVIGESWKDCDVSCTVIMDRTNELEFLVSDAIRKENMLEVVTLDSPVRRENKTTRLELRLSFPDRNTAVLKIKDTGFGEFYETNYRVWEQTLKL